MNTNNYPFKNLSNNLKKNSVTYKEFEYKLIHDIETKYLYITFKNLKTNAVINNTKYPVYKLNKEIIKDYENIKQYIWNCVSKENQKLKKPNILGYLPEKESKQLIKNMFSEFKISSESDENELKNFDNLLNGVTVQKELEVTLTKDKTELRHPMEVTLTKTDKTILKIRKGSETLEQEVTNPLHSLKWLKQQVNNVNDELCQEVSRNPTINNLDRDDIKSHVLEYKNSIKDYTGIAKIGDMNNFKSLIAQLKDHRLYFAENIEEEYEELKDEIFDKNGKKKEIILYKSLKKLAELILDKIYKQELEYNYHLIRINPPYNLNTSENILKEIKSNGLIPYLEKLISKLHLGENKGIYRKFLACFSVMCGKMSCFCETQSQSGAGKSLEDEIITNYIIPPMYVFKANHVTEAGFTRKAQATNINYFDRKIIVFGDLGRGESFKKLEDVFNIVKILVTEKEYHKLLAEKNGSGFESKKLHLKANSIMAMYGTTLNSFTEGDNQLESRTLKNSTSPVSNEDILDNLGYLNTTVSKEYKNQQKVIKKLLKFQELQKMLVNKSQELEIINPYTNVFKKYSLKADVPTREFKQQLELFNTYCLLTFYECNKIKEYYIASEKQLKDYFNLINLESALIPYESDFIKMLMGDGLTIIQEESEKEELNKYFNKIIELLNYWDNNPSMEELNPKDQDRVINETMRLFRLKNKNNKELVFFTISDLKENHKNARAFKNINNLNDLLFNLNKKGYIGKLENKYRGGFNIYYLLSKCYDVKAIDIIDDDIKKASEYLEHIGIL